MTAPPKAFGSWREAPPLNHARHRTHDRALTLMLLPDGAVLCRGGCVFRGGKDVRVSTAELRDPESGLWRVIPSPMANELQKGARPVRAPIYTGTPAWTAWSANKLDQWAYARAGDVRVVLDNGDVLLAGGFQTTDNMGPFEGSDEDEPSTVLYRHTGVPRWRYAGHLAGPRTAAAGVLLHDGRVLIAGGHAARSITTFATVEIWEPLGNPPVV